MTSTATPAFAREALAATSLRRSLTAMIRRRVSAHDAEDVAQTVLCDALASSSLPVEPEDLRRFVVGIARHKVADFHRHARRHERDEEATSELVAEPPPVEARALLGRIAESVAGSDRERETLEWLVREHAGEQLQTIAADVGLPAPAVRQRVSRLRRILRAQWAHALALLVVAGTCGALASRSHRGDASIIIDPDGDPVVRAALALQGSWRVEHATTDESHAAAAVEARLVDVRINGRRIEVRGPAHTMTRTLEAVSTRADGSLALTLRDEHGGVQHGTATIIGERIHLTLLDGRLRGSADLVRR